MIATIASLKDHVGQEVTLQGWLYNSRDSGKIAFLVVRDGTGLCQCVVAKNDQTAAFFEDARRLPQETALRVSGTVRADPKQVGGHELTVTGLEVVHRREGYPITPKPHGIEFLMKHRHLHFRSRRQWTILRIRHTLIDEIRSYFNRNGFTLIDTPIFAPAAGEGAQTLFEVDYFGEKVYLAQTGQLYVEAACMSHGKVYCFGPTFRAEKSKTRRHLTEFWMVEPEIAYAELEDVLSLAEDFVCCVVQRVLRDHRADLEFLGRDPAPLENVRKPFYRLTHKEAAGILRGPRARELLESDLKSKSARIEAIKTALAEKEKTLAGPGVKEWQRDKLTQELYDLREELADLEVEVQNIPHHMQLAASFDPGGDLGGSDETIISRLHDRPVFVTHYPRACKAFYMKRNADDATRVNNVDLLAPDGYGEIIGGSQREENYDALLERIHEEGLNPADYEWYLDLRRYGSVPHGGFGLGVERTLAWLNVPGRGNRCMGRPGSVAFVPTATRADENRNPVRTLMGALPAAMTAGIPAPDPPETPRRINHNTKPVVVVAVVGRVPVAIRRAAVPRLVVPTAAAQDTAPCQPDPVERTSSLPKCANAMTSSWRSPHGRSTMPAAA
ncbi:MAG: asparagine--tRNA ligase [Phycisphaerae bacterium]|nr:asparagine--tRNA ligase [Phycisphaerae bacterium]